MAVNRLRGPKSLSAVLRYFWNEVFHMVTESHRRVILDIQETNAIVAGLHVSPPAGQGEMLFDKLGKMRCARTRSID